VDPDNACRLCDGQAPAARLWDNPLDLGSADAPGAPDAPGATVFRTIRSFVARGLDASLDGSQRGLLRQRLAVPTLRLKGCTPDTLLRELDTRLMDVLLDETAYSAEELRALGFVWKTYLLAGFRAGHLKKARARFGADLFTTVIGTVPNLAELCARDTQAMAALGLKVAEWVLLCPRLMPPAYALQQAGFRARDVIALGFSLQEWHEVLRLDQNCMRLLNFETAHYFELTQFDSKLQDEFIHRFRFNPFSQPAATATWPSSSTSATTPTPFQQLLSPWSTPMTPSGFPNTTHTRS